MIKTTHCVLVLTLAAIASIVWGLIDAPASGTPTRVCAEDARCWNSATMGNGIGNVTPDAPCAGELRSLPSICFETIDK